jgi:tRNA modification GTPase
VWTKSDLRDELRAREVPRPTPLVPRPTIQVSAERGEGLRELLASAERSIAERWGAPPVDAPVLTRERHRHALTLARDELAEFERAWQQSSLPAPVAAVHIRAAASALEELIGAVDVEDVLDRVFSSFCVGK